MTKHPYVVDVVAGKGRSITPLWPWLTAHLQRSAGGRLSLWSWSTHMPRGRPGRRRHWLLGGHDVTVECLMGWNVVQQSGYMAEKISICLAYIKGKHVNSLNWCVRTTVNYSPN